MLKSLIESGQFELVALYILNAAFLVNEREKEERGAAPQPERQKTRVLFDNPG